MAKAGDAISRKIRERFVALEGKQTPVSPSVSRERGKSLREAVPREAHATWVAPEDRADPVDLLRSQEASRVQELLPERHERMAVSAFAFYRGAALVMASDLASTPTTGIKVQLCGDANISNFSLFDTPEGRTVFDIVDFDETAKGSWEWDVKRLAASVEVCGRDRGLSVKKREAAVLACAQGYRETMRALADMGSLDVWHAHVGGNELQEGVKGQISKKGAKTAEKTLAKANAKDPARALRKLTEIVDGQLRVISDPPLVIPLRDLVEAGEDLPIEFGGVDMADLTSRILFDYRQSLSHEKRMLIDRYVGVDVARKAVGVGGVGTRAWVVALQGSSSADSLVLQIKEAQDSVIEQFAGKSRYREKGRRVVEGQRAMQTVPDLLLGWCHLMDPDGEQHHYYVRQLWDRKDSFDLSRIDPKGLSLLSRSCGSALAHAHARTGDRFAIAGYLGKKGQFDQALASFAASYADQNLKDYQRFLEARKTGEHA